MRVLVTGSRGFIGRELVKELKKRHQVKEFDLALGNDLLNDVQVREAVKGVDAVVHCAALLDENASREKLFEVNVQGTGLLLNECVKAIVKRFVFLSTVGVMGNIKGKVDEKTSLKPVTNYEKSKAKAEEMVLGFKERVPVTVLRSALVLGPNEYWRKIINLVGKGFPVIGGGENQFQLIYFKDLVSAIVFALERMPARGEVFIVAEEKGKTLKELCVLIQMELGIGKEIKTVPVWFGRALGFFYSLLGRKSIVSKAHISRLVRERNYSIRKIRAFGWKPSYSTEEAVRETVKGLN